MYHYRGEAAECRFNPRIREGCDDHASPRSILNKIVSIHASVRDATQSVEVSNPVTVKVSIHASVRDATSSDMPEDRIHKVSIHASVRDATCHDSSGSKPCAVVSIHASVRDATGNTLYCAAIVPPIVKTHFY